MAKRNIIRVFEGFAINHLHLLTSQYIYYE